MAKAHTVYVACYTYYEAGRTTQVVLVLHFVDEVGEEERDEMGPGFGEERKGFLPDLEAFVRILLGVRVRSKPDAQKGTTCTCTHTHMRISKHHTPHTTRHTPHTNATRHTPHATRHTPHATRHQPIIIIFKPHTRRTPRKPHTPHLAVVRMGIVYTHTQQQQDQGAAHSTPPCSCEDGHSVYTHNTTRRRSSSQYTTVVAYVSA